MSQVNSPLMYLGSFFISSTVHFVIKYSTQTTDQSDIASLIMPQLQVGIITLVAVFVSSQLFAQEKMADEETKKDPVTAEQKSPTLKKESKEADYSSPIKAKKVEIFSSQETTDTSSKKELFLDSPRKGSESRRSFKKDKEVDNLKKRISEFENERRQLDKNHQKRLTEREDNLKIQHSEELDRVTQQHKDERDRQKREQKDEITNIKKKALKDARDDLTTEIKDQLKTQYEKDYEEKLKKEVETIKAKEAASQEKKRDGSLLRTPKSGRGKSKTAREATNIDLGKQNDEEINKLRQEKAEAQKNYMSCQQNLEEQKRLNEQFKKQLTDLEKKLSQSKNIKTAENDTSKKIEKEKQELKAKLEEQANLMTQQIDLLKQNNEENKKTYETLKQRSFKEIENLKNNHQKEITQLKQSKGKESEQSKSQKDKGVDLMKQMLAKEFEQRIKKQQDIIQEMNEAHQNKMQQLKQNSEKEKVEIEQQFEKQANAQKNVSKQQLIILERKQKFHQQQNQKNQEFEVQKKVQEALEQQKRTSGAGPQVIPQVTPQVTVPQVTTSQVTGQQMITALQGKLKQQYESVLEQKLKELEEQSNESARNINDMMRKKRLEYKSEKQKLEEKIKTLEKQVTTAPSQPKKSEQVAAPQMLAAIQNRLKSEFDSILEKKLQEQVEQSNESARNMNDMMRRKRVEFKADKDKLSQRIQQQEQQIQHLQKTLKDMKDMFTQKFSQAKDQSKQHQEGVNYEITDLKDQVKSLRTESTQLEQVLQQKDQDLAKKQSELDQMNTLVVDLEVQDTELDKVLKEKFKVKNEEQKSNKKSKQLNGSMKEALSSRLKSKLDKLVEETDLKITDLQYTIDTKEGELQEQQKKMDGMFIHIKELNEEIEQLNAAKGKAPEAKKVEEPKPKEEPKKKKDPKPKEEKVVKPKEDSPRKQEKVKAKPEQIQEQKKAPEPQQIEETPAPEKVEKTPEPTETKAVVPTGPLPLFETTFAPGEFSRDKVKALDVSLKQLVICLKEALNGVSQVNGKDIIVCLGNTGSGKTTMVNSLVHGPESLEIMEIKEKVKVKKGKTKEVKKMVIEQKEEFKAKKLLKIGHSSALSETFRPDTVVNDKTGLMFVDVAGFEDSGSPLVELVNMFVNKHIFNISKSISFLMTITMNEVTNNRGQSVRELVNVLNVMCPSELSTLKDAVIPILTKSKPGDQEVDIDEVRSSVEASLTDEFEKILQTIQDPKIKEATLKEYQLFVSKFQESFVMYDPLDRPMPGQDQEAVDQGTKQKELLQRLTSLQSTQSEDFNAPFTRKSYANLQAIIQKDMKKIDQTINDMIAEAKKQGEKFDKSIANDPVYSQLMSDLKFMRDNRLLSEAADYIKKLENKIKTSQNLISDAKMFEKMNQVGKQAFTIDKKLVQHQNSNSVVELARGMQDANNFINDLKKKISECKNMDESSELELYKSRFTRKLEDIVTQLSTTSMNTLFSLCYELLKLEADCKPENKFVKQMLEGCMKPSVLVDIVCSNTYDQQTNSMTPAAKKFFRVQLNPNSHLAYKKKTFGTQAVALRQNNAKKQKDHSSKFQFTLTSGGGLLVTTEESHILMSEAGKIEPIAAQSPMIGENQGQAQNPKDGMLWTLTPPSISAQREELPYFHLEQPYDSVRPRLLCQSDSTLTISSKDSKKYRDEKSAKWMIMKEGE